MTAAAPASFDQAAWRLASALAAVKRQADSAGETPAGSKLRGMQATAELFFELKRDPFETLARCLQSIDLSAHPPELESKLAAEVQSYLAALESTGPMTPALPSHSR